MLLCNKTQPYSLNHVKTTIKTAGNKEVLIPEICG